MHGILQPVLVGMFELVLNTVYALVSFSDERFGYALSSGSDLNNLDHL